MSSKRLFLTVGLPCVAILCLGYWTVRSNRLKVEGVAKSQGRNFELSEKQGDPKADHAVSKRQAHQKSITDPERFVLAKRAIRNIKFSSKIEEAEIELKEEFAFLYSLPPSHERYFLIPDLITAYSKAAFEASTSKEDLLERMQRFGSIIQGAAEAEDTERLLIVASMQCAKMIAELPDQESGVLRAYLEGHGNSGDQQMGSRIIASSYVRALVENGSPDASIIDGISNEDVKRFTEQTILLTFDFDLGSAKVVETFAARYLDETSKIAPDKNIAIRLFGLGLQTNPEAISAVILNAPPGQKKDEAIQQMIYRIAKSDPERADLWLEGIQDHNVKNKTREIMLEKRNDSDPPTIVADPDKDPFK